MFSKKKKRKKERKNSREMYGVRARVFNADCWLEVTFHPEGPATGQLDQDFPWFSLVPE
jgi:hypothetical protein